MSNNTFIQLHGRLGIMMGHYFNILSLENLQGLETMKRNQGKRDFIAIYASINARVLTYGKAPAQYTWVEKNNPSMLEVSSKYF